MITKMSKTGIECNSAYRGLDWQLAMLCSGRGQCIVENTHRLRYVFLVAKATVRCMCCHYTHVPETEAGSHSRKVDVAPLPCAAPSMIPGRSSSCIFASL